jgi:hypothetical protein
MQESTPIAGLSRLIGRSGRMPGLPGWRRSADRTYLRPISLLTGNFTGNFAILVPRGPISLHETPVLQPFLEQFPTQTNRENILRNREFLAGNREFLASKMLLVRKRRKRPFLTHLFGLAVAAICSHRQICR